MVCEIIASARRVTPQYNRFPDASVAQLDRVLGYEPSGRRFESSRMHHILLSNSENVVSWSANLSSVPGRITLRKQRPEGRGAAESSSRMHHILLSNSLLLSNSENVVSWSAKLSPAPGRITLRKQRHPLHASLAIPITAFFIPVSSDFLLASRAFHYNLSLYISVIRLR